MVNFSFQPKVLTNHVGDTVLWTNTVSTGHNVVSTNSAWSPPPLFTSPGTFAVTFTTAGVYGYYCSPHRSIGMTGVIYVEGAANQPPIVALTNPPPGLTLAAPATITLAASAEDPDGSITNVQFFSGTTLLGSVSSAPYMLAVADLPGGTYHLTARAQDNQGLGATSGVVTVSVLTPNPIVLDPGLQVGSDSVQLKVMVTPGLRYSIDQSGGPGDWQSLTNFTATDSVMTLTSPLEGSDRRFFRARLLPNP